MYKLTDILGVKHPIIMENLHGIKRVKGTNQKAKKPILINDLKQIINIIDQYISNCELPEMEKSKEVKNKLRDKAIILIGFAGGLEDQN